MTVYAEADANGSDFRRAHYFIKIESSFLLHLANGPFVGIRLLSKLSLLSVFTQIELFAFEEGAIRANRRSIRFDRISRRS